MSTTIQQTYTDEEVMEMITPYIGTTYTQVVLKAIARASLRPVRQISPHSAGTMDMRRERINLVLDENDVILSIRFG
jgi:hypothetical protein